MVFGLADLGQVVVLREGSMLSNELERADQVVITLDYLLLLDLLIKGCLAACNRIGMLLAFVGLTHGQTSYKLELIADEVRVVDDGSA